MPIGRLTRKFLSICLALTALTTLAGAQPSGYFISARNAEHLADTAGLRSRVAFLADSLCAGRASGTPGSLHAQSAIARQFAAYGLKPAGGTYFHGFRTLAGGPAHNVVGFLPGSGDRYVVVAAHYDHIGTLSGTLYPGADSNASGVAALLTLAQMFRHLKDLGKTYSHTIIFAALDGKEKDLAGSRELWRLIDQGKLLDPVSGTPIGKDQIMLVVNLDQLGATLAPLTKGNPNYLMMLSDSATGWRSTLENANRDQHIGLEIGYSYYGSADFTRLFYTRICDQRVFLEHEIPAVMFTSGITLNNNKATDTPDSLDYPVMRKRIQLIFYWLDKVL